MNLPRVEASHGSAAGNGGGGGGNERDQGGMLPLASSIDIVVDGQIRGLEGAYEYLRTVRERQKAKLMEMVYGAGSRRSGSILDSISGKLDEIEGR